MSFSRINKAFLNRVRVLSKVFGEADLTAAALTQTLDVGDVPAGAHVVGVNLRAFTPFTGGGITAFTCSIGDANETIASSRLRTSSRPRSTVKRSEERRVG